MWICYVWKEVGVYTKSKVQDIISPQKSVWYHRKEGILQYLLFLTVTLFYYYDYCLSSLYFKQG